MKYSEILESKEKKILESLLILLGFIILGNIFGSVLGLAIIYVCSSLNFNQSFNLTSAPSLYQFGWYYFTIFFFVSTLLSFFGAGMIYWKYIEKKNFSDFILNKSLHIRTVVLACASLLSLTPFLSWVQEKNEAMKLPNTLKGVEDWMQAMEQSMAKSVDFLTNFTSIHQLIISIIMMGFLAGLGEELIFRGIVQRKIYLWTKNPHLAIFLAAVIFSAIHFQFYGFFPRLLLGMLLGYLYYWTGNIWVPIICHAFNNSMAIVITYLVHLKMISPEFEKVSHFSTIKIVESLISFVLFAFIINTKKT